MARPQGINDLHILWTIKRINSELLNSSERLLLYQILAWQGNQESIYHSAETLGEQLGLSRNHIRKNLSSLTKKNFLTLVHQGRAGRGNSNKYSINYLTILSHQHPVDNLQLNGHPMTFNKLKGSPHDHITGLNGHPMTLLDGLNGHPVPMIETKDLDTKEERGTPSDFFEPSDKLKAMAEEKGLDLHHLWEKYKRYLKKNGHHKTDLQMDLELQTWVLTEKVTGPLKGSQKTLLSQKAEIEQRPIENKRCEKCNRTKCFCHHTNVQENLAKMRNMIKGMGKVN